MKLVLIESPYAGDVERNEAYARAAMKDSLRRGEAPFASHLLYTQPGVLLDAQPGVLLDALACDRRQGIEAGLAWGSKADLTAVYYDLGVSAGMYEGIDRAYKEGREVEWRLIKS